MMGTTLTYIPANREHASERRLLQHAYARFVTIRYNSALARGCECDFTVIESQITHSCVFGQKRFIRRSEALDASDIASPYSTRFTEKRLISCVGKRFLLAGVYSMVLVWRQMIVFGHYSHDWPWPASKSFLQWGVVGLHDGFPATISAIQIRFRYSNDGEDWKVTTGEV